MDSDAPAVVAANTTGFRTKDMSQNLQINLFMKKYDVAMQIQQLLNDSVVSRSAGWLSYYAVHISCTLFLQSQYTTVRVAGFRVRPNFLRKALSERNASSEER